MMETLCPASLVPGARQQMRPMRIWGSGEVPDTIWGLSAQMRAVRTGVQGPWLPIYNTRGNQSSLGAERPSGGRVIFPTSGAACAPLRIFLSPRSRRGTFHNGLEMSPLHLPHPDL